MATQVTAPAERTTLQQESATPPPKQAGGRLVSLDAYRGFIMLLLVSEGFGLGALKGQPAWAWLAAAPAAWLTPHANRVRWGWRRMNHPPSGLLTMLTIVIALAADLFLLPVMLRWYDSRRRSEAVAEPVAREALGG